MKIVKKISQTLWIYEDKAGRFVAWANWHKDFNDVLKWREKALKEFEKTRVQ